MSGIPSASYDALVIAAAQTASEDGVTAAEIHVFAYLACLLTVYDGKEAGWWGYSFVGTKVGAPYSSILAEAVEELVATGLMEKSRIAMRITPEGHSELTTLSTFASYSPRERYITAACSCALVLPLAALGEMLKREPQLHSTVGLMQSRALLDETGIAQLEPHFDALRKALSDEEEDSVTETDLMVPAAVWLTYLARQG